MGHFMATDDIALPFSLSRDNNGNFYPPITATGTACRHTHTYVFMFVRQFPAASTLFYRFVRFVCSLYAKRSE